MLDALKRRSDQLKTIIKNCEKRLLVAPSGTLVIINDRGKKRFYVYDGSYRYINRKNIKTAEMLAQKKYDITTLNEAKTELKKTNELISIVESYDNPLNAIPEQLFDKIEINALSDMEYALKWQKQSYKRKKVSEDSQYFTHKNEHVRSKSECIIADTLNKYNIPYHYEMPISIDGEIIQHPDFCALNVRTRKAFIWEHFGMMEDSDYCKEALLKINRYNKFGYMQGKNLITTFESANCPLNTRNIVRQINEYLK